jgi:CRP-like cAMP-binding protein
MASSVLPSVRPRHRRNAIERTAHFFMELAGRLNLIGLGTEAEFKCPVTQFVLADALGLTAIHVKRVPRQLRELKLLPSARAKLTFTTWLDFASSPGFRAAI